MDREKIFLEQYELIKKEITNIFSIMENAISIEELNVTVAIKNVVNKFLEIIHFDNDDLSKEQIKNINNKIEKIKKFLIKLKNEQVYFYNLKVQEINYRLMEIKRIRLSSGLNEKLSEVDVLKFNNNYLYRDWKNSNYNKLYKYDELIKVNNIVFEFESELGVKYDKSLNLKIKIDYCEQFLKNIKNNINYDETEVLLDKCVYLFEKIIKIDILIRRYVDNGDIDKVDVENYRITTLYYELDKLKNQLFSKIGLTDFYLLKDKLGILKKEIIIIQDIVYNDYDKCNRVIIRRFNIRLDYLKDNLMNLKNKTNLLKNNNKLDINKFNKLFIEIEEIDNFLEVIDSKLTSYCLLNIDNILDKKEEMFNNCFFAVRNIKSADNVYKKYKKECLYVSGLSSVVLLETSPLIPAIMYCATSVGIKLPLLDKFANSINSILGGMINARQKGDKQWFLSNEIEIGPSVTVTSLFQGLVFSKKADKLVIKKIVNVGRKMKLKYKQLIKAEEILVG